MQSFVDVSELVTNRRNDVIFLLVRLDKMEHVRSQAINYVFVSVIKQSPGSCLEVASFVETLEVFLNLL